MNKQACSQGQFMVDRIAYDGKKPRARRANQVLNKKTGVIRPDKRKKCHYL